MTNKDYLLGVEYGMQKGKSEERTRILEIIENWCVDNHLNIQGRQIGQIKQLKATISDNSLKTVNNSSSIESESGDTQKGCGKNDKVKFKDGEGYAYF